MFLFDYFSLSLVIIWSVNVIRGSGCYRAGSMCTKDRTTFERRSPLLRRCLSFHPTLPLPYSLSLITRLSSLHIFSFSLPHSIFHHSSSTRSVSLRFCLSLFLSFHPTLSPSILSFSHSPLSAFVLPPLSSLLSLFPIFVTRSLFQFLPLSLPFSFPTLSPRPSFSFSTVSLRFCLSLFLFLSYFLSSHPLLLSISPTFFIFTPLSLSLLCLSVCLSVLSVAKKNIFASSWPSYTNKNIRKSEQFPHKFNPERRHLICKLQTEKNPQKTKTS